MLSNGKIKKLADRGVRIARKENFVYGLPNVMSKDEVPNNIKTSGAR